MAHFYRWPDNKGLDFLKMNIGQSVEMALWGGGENGEALRVSVNDPNVAVVPDNLAGNSPLRFTITGKQSGNCMLEAKSSAGNIWAFTQVIVSNAASPGASAGKVVEPVPGYENMPKTLLTVLRRSYDEKTADNLNLANAMGWPPAKTANDMTFKEVLDGLAKPGLLSVIQAIHDRCVKVPGLWEKIHVIRNVWDYTAGGGVSQGMLWTAKDPDGTVALLRGVNVFCEDIWPMNADHQKDSSNRWCLRRTFREIVASGSEGLHVCVVAPAYRSQDKWGGEHDIHIDRHQIGCVKYKANPNITLQAPNGSCVYLGLVDHAKDAIPYFLKKFGIDIKLNQLIGGLSGLVNQVGMDRVRSEQVANLFTRLFPAMPSPVASEAGEWFLKVMREFDPQKLLRKGSGE
jgi:hypothetical protein